MSVNFFGFQSYNNSIVEVTIEFEDASWSKWRRKWQPTPVSLPGKSHGWTSLEGYSPWGHKESDMTEQVTLSLSRKYVPMDIYFGRDS